MKPSLLPSALTGALLVLSLLIAVPAAAQAPAPAAAQPAADARVASIAKLLAGLPPTHPDHAALAKSAAWQEHSQALQASWARVRDGQVAALNKWRQAELPGACPAGKTLLYPFSGPDFVNAHALFPGCSAMVLFGLERIGDVPPIEKMSEQQFANLLAGVRGFLTNLFERNYFVTGTMQKGVRETPIQGIVPIFMALMALSGVEVLKVAPEMLPAPAPAAAAAAPREGEPPAKAAPAGAARDLRGVTIDYRATGSAQVQRMTYFSLDVTDAGLAKHPQFLDYLRGLGTTTTLLKSASYLLHGKLFSKVRDVIIEDTAFLVQDDTGLPYWVMQKRGWEVKLYGRYGRPIPAFATAYQPALAAAYEKGPVKPLPFRFGYYLDKQQEDLSHLIVARRPAGSTGQTPPATGTAPR